MLLGFLAILGADVDEQAFGLGNLFALLGRHQVDGLFADHARHDLLPAVDEHPLAGQHRVVEPADRLEEQVPPVVDVRDHQTDFVHVTGQHDPQRRADVDAANNVAVHIGPHLVAHVGQTLADHRLGPFLKARRAVRGHQFLKKRLPLFLHLKVSFIARVRIGCDRIPLLQ